VNDHSPILIASTNMTQYSYYESPCFHVSYFTQKGFEKNRNDDALLIYPINPHTLVLAIVDGVGSAAHGDKAALFFLSQLKSALSQTTGKTDLEQLRTIILNTLIRAHEELSALPGHLTTATLCVLHHDTMQVYQVGDSGLMLCGQRGKLKYHTTFQSPVGYALASGLFTQAQANAHPENHFVTHLLGAGENTNIEMSTPMHLAPYDSILLATDGLFDNVVFTDLAEQIRKGEHQTVSGQLTEMVQTQKNSLSGKHFKKDDDISFILCRLT
jgi:PPM family protein phosphatase